MRSGRLVRGLGLGWKSGGSDASSNTLYAFALGPLEIILIVVAVILVFGVGKLSRVGGAMGKSVREFRREKDGLGEEVRLLPAGRPDDSGGCQSEDTPRSA